jgi:acyl transferase domain-containing protein/NAD(P)-dependent dehydrogenase (short-subunit alcohol dehydrogenase family)
MSPEKSAPSSPIAIIGVGSRFPKARDTDAFWANLYAGRTAFGPVPKDRWNHEVFYSANQRDVDKSWANAGSFIEDYQEFAALHYGIAPRRLEVMDPQQRLLIETTRIAIQDAGYERRDFPRRRTGVYVGLSIAEFQQLANARLLAMRLIGGDFGGTPGSDALREALMDLTDHVVPIRAFTLSGSLTALAAAAVAQTFDLGGPAYTLDSACASASIAVHDAVNQLRAGQIDAAVAGGAYLNLAPDNLVAFTKIGAISPTGACRPFDAKADGFVQSDGVAMVFLKRLEDALADHDRIYAVIRGSGANNDGRGEGPMTPRKEGQVEVLHRAYADAGLSPATVSYFEAHGTATSIGDPVEVEALGTVLLEAGVTAEAPALLGSVKGNIGHAMSAAGVAGLVKAIKVLQTRTAPPQPNFHEANPKLNLDRYPLQVPTAPTPIAPRQDVLRVAVSSFGFGGTNSHIILEAPPAQPRRPRVARPLAADLDPSAEPAAAGDAPRPEAVLVSAPTLPLLAAHLGALAEALERGPAREASLADVAYTLNARRQHERFRAVIGAATPAALVEHLRAAQAAAGAPGAAAPVVVGKHVAIHDSGEPDAPQRKVAFLFPGQGAQRVGLMADVKARFLDFSEAFDAYAQAADRGLPRPLASYLYPGALADEAARVQAEKALEATEVCQPAMAALGLATAAFLRELGVTPAVSLGHSLGEFAALASGGVITPEDAVHLVTVRGAAMRALRLEDTGTMAAVMADAETVQAALQDIPGVWVANVNHPRQVSISGTTLGVARATEALEGMGLEVQPLSVSHAFHTPLMDGVSARLEPMVGRLRFAAPTHVVASCIDPEPHSGEAQRTAQVILRHATAPVHFSRGLAQARAAGATVFVQMGAGSVLTNLARATLGRDDVFTVTLAPVEPDGGYTLVQGLCTLAALGVPVALERLYLGDDRRVVTLPETPLVREAYWPLKDYAHPRAVITAPLPGADTRAVTVAGAPAAPDAGQPAAPAGLVELFAEQARILSATTEIIAAQNRLLASGATPGAVTDVATQVSAILERGARSGPRAAETGVPGSPGPGPDDLASRAAETGGPGSPGPGPDDLASGARSGPRAAETGGPGLPGPGPEVSPKGPAPDAVRAQVMDVVARVSAFPKGSLRSEQRLVDELGFDSLMVADLGGALQGAFPDLGPLPPKLFGLKTTVKDLADHVVKVLTASAPATPKAAAPAAPKTAGRYRVVAAERPRGAFAPVALAGQAWLVTEDGSPLATEVSAQLAARGAEVVRVRFVDGGVSAPASLSRGPLNLWPSAFVEGLPDALQRAGVTLSGVIHAAALSLGDATDFVNPVERLHPLAARLHAPHFVTLTAMGGRLGLERSTALAKNVLQATLTGYTKALARERPEDRVRSLDLDPALDARAAAAWVVDEVVGGDLAPEVGFDGRRWVAEVVSAPALPAKRTLTREDVVLITGGAGELGRVAATWVAKQRPKALLLVGRRAATPEHEALVAELSSHGTAAEYVAADITDKEAFRAALRPALERRGPVTVVFHAAGLIEDAQVPNKTLESVRRVMDVKARGLQVLLRTFPNVRDVVLFSSWAGRFGNAGQADYAAANELLDRVAVTGAGTARVLSLVFPPWRSTAMVRSIPAAVQAMMEAQGVTFLDDEEGLAALADAFTEGAGGIELVGRGLPAREIRAVHAERFALATHPYLDDHRLKGRPVVPLASVTDLMGWAFRETTGREGPLVVEDLELIRGVMGEDLARVEVTARRGQDAFTQAELEVRVDDAVAYRARAHNRLVELPEAPALTGDAVTPAADLDAFYRDQTFHGPRLRGVQQVLRMTAAGIEGVVKAAPIAAWLVGTARPAWTADPLVLDGSFQLAGYWLFQHHGKAGFPTGFERLVLARPFGPGPVRATVTLRDVTEDGFAGDIHYADEVGRPIGFLSGIQGRFADVGVEAKPGRDAQGPAVPDETWQIDKFPEVEELDQRLQMAELIGLQEPVLPRARRHRPGHQLGGGGRGDDQLLQLQLPGLLGAPRGGGGRPRGHRSLRHLGVGQPGCVGRAAFHRELERGLAAHVGVDDAVVWSPPATPPT